jgi:hypothetical protein
MIVRNGNKILLNISQIEELIKKELEKAKKEKLKKAS